MAVLTGLALLWLQGDWVYADKDGILVSPEELKL